MSTSPSRVARIGALVLILHALWMVWLFGGLAIDDAYISFRYSDNLANGLGLVFNSGEHVEGYSNFLWVMLLTPFSWAIGDLTWPSIVLGLIMAGTSVMLVPRALARLFGVESTGPTAVAVGLIAMSGYVAAWAGGGLETALHGLLLLALWYRFVLEHEEGGAPISALLVAALALTRPEGIFVAIAALVVRIAQGGKWRSWVVLLLAVLGAYHAWRFSTFGPWLFPNPVRAKVGLTVPQLTRGLDYVATSFLVPYAPLLLTLALLRSPRRLAALSGLALLWGHLAFDAAVGGDWSHGRFFAPLLPLGAVLFGAAVAPLLSRRPVVGLVALWLAVTFVITSPMREAPFRTRFAGKDKERVDIGRWLARKSPEGVVVAVFAAGQIPYYSHRYSHDMLGLTDPRISELDIEALGAGTAGHEKFDLDYSIGELQPDVIVDGHHVAGLMDRPDVKGGYVRVPLWKRNQVLVKRGATWWK